MRSWSSESTMALHQFIRRRIPAIVVLQRVSCTTIITISGSLMCITISDSLMCNTTVLAGHTNRLAFLARQVSRIGQHRSIPAIVVLQRASCATITTISDNLMCFTISNSLMCVTISGSLVCIIISIILRWVTVVMKRISCTTNQ